MSVTANAHTAEHAQGHEDVVTAVRSVDVEAYCQRARVEVAPVAEAAADRGAQSGSILEDLGIQQVSRSAHREWLPTPGHNHVPSRIEPLGTNPVPDERPAT